MSSADDQVRSQGAIIGARDARLSRIGAKFHLYKVLSAFGIVIGCHSPWITYVRYPGGHFDLPIPYINEYDYIPPTPAEAMEGMRRKRTFRDKITFSSEVKRGKRKARKERKPLISRNQELYLQYCLNKFKEDARTTFSKNDTKQIIRNFKMDIKDGGRELVTRTRELRVKAIKKKRELEIAYRDWKDPFFKEGEKSIADERLYIAERQEERRNMAHRPFLTPSGMQRGEWGGSKDIQHDPIVGPSTRARRFPLSGQSPDEMLLWIESIILSQEEFFAGIPVPWKKRLKRALKRWVRRTKRKWRLLTTNPFLYPSLLEEHDAVVSDIFSMPFPYVENKVETRKDMEETFQAMIQNLENEELQKSTGRAYSIASDWEEPERCEDEPQEFIPQRYLPADRNLFHAYEIETGDPARPKKWCYVYQLNPYCAYVFEDGADMTYLLPERQRESPYWQEIHPFLKHRHGRIYSCGSCFDLTIGDVVAHDGASIDENYTWKEELFPSKEKGKQPAGQKSKSKEELESSDAQGLSKKAKGKLPRPIDAESVEGSESEWDPGEPSDDDRDDEEEDGEVMEVCGMDERVRTFIDGDLNLAIARARAWRPVDGGTLPYDAFRNWKTEWDPEEQRYSYMLAFDSDEEEECVCKQTKNTSSTVAKLKRPHRVRRSRLQSFFTSLKHGLSATPSSILTALQGSDYFSLTPIAMVGAKLSRTSVNLWTALIKSTSRKTVHSKVAGPVASSQVIAIATSTIQNGKGSAPFLRRLFGSKHASTQRGHRRSFSMAEIVLLTADAVGGLVNVEHSNDDTSRPTTPSTPQKATWLQWVGGKPATKTGMQTAGLSPAAKHLRSILKASGSVPTTPTRPPPKKLLDTPPEPQDIGHCVLDADLEDSPIQQEQRQKDNIELLIEQADADPVTQAKISNLRRRHQKFVPAKFIIDENTDPRKIPTPRKVANMLHFQKLEELPVHVQDTDQEKGGTANDDLNATITPRRMMKAYSKANTDTSGSTVTIDGQTVQVSKRELPKGLIITQSFDSDTSLIRKNGRQRVVVEIDWRFTGIYCVLAFVAAGAVALAVIVGVKAWVAKQPTLPSAPVGNPALASRSWGGYNEHSLSEKCYRQERTAILLSIFLGSLGIDQWYARHWVLAVFKMLTGGGFGIWWTVDTILWVVGGVYGTPGCPGGSGSWRY